MNDLKFAFRQLLKNPGFAAVAVLTLALGIGANTAMFSVLNAVLLRPLPFTDPERLMFVEGQNWRELSGGDFNDLNTRSRSFSHVAAFFGNATYNLSSGNEPERVSASRSGSAPRASPPRSCPRWASNRCAAEISLPTRTEPAAKKSSC